MPASSRRIFLSRAALAAAALAACRPPAPVLYDPPARTIKLHAPMNPLAQLVEKPFNLLENGVIKSKDELNRMLKERAREAQRLPDLPKFKRLAETLNQYLVNQEANDTKLKEAYEEANACYELLMMHFRDFAVAATELGCQGLSEEELCNQISKQKNTNTIVKLQDSINNINRVLDEMFPDKI